jgi:hypothetical protein
MHRSTRAHTNTHNVANNEESFWKKAVVTGLGIFVSINYAKSQSEEIVI